MQLDAFNSECNEEYSATITIYGKTMCMKRNISMYKRGSISPGREVHEL